MDWFDDEPLPLDFPESPIRRRIRQNEQLMELTRTTGRPPTQAERFLIQSLDTVFKAPRQPRSNDDE